MNENELQLQRLVDGQLDRGQVQQLLAKAQQQPELWQQIALGFVEDQIWEAEIGDGFLETADPTTNPTPVSTDSPCSFANVERPSTTEPERASQSSMGRAKLLLSLAAATLIGLWLGNQLGNNQTTDSGTEEIVVLRDGGDSDTMPDPDGSDIPGRDKLADGVPSVENQVTTVSRPTFKPVQHISIDDVGEIPLYTLADAEKMGMTFTEPEIPKELVEEYQRQGYWLQGNTQLISGRIASGQRVVVPVRSFSLNPVN